MACVCSTAEDYYFHVAKLRKRRGRRGQNVNQFHVDLHWRRQLQLFAVAASEPAKAMAGNIATLTLVLVNGNRCCLCSALLPALWQYLPYKYRPKQADGEEEEEEEEHIQAQGERDKRRHSTALANVCKERSAIACQAPLPFLFLFSFAASGVVEKTTHISHLNCCCQLSSQVKSSECVALWPVTFAL